MSKTGYQVCQDCFQHLATKNPYAASFWSYLCCLSNNSFKDKQLSQFDNRYKILEEEGFLLTTEVSEKHLMIAIRGHIPDQQVICLNKHDHDINQKI